MPDPAELARTIVEECWSDEAGLDRMATLVGPGYVHHSAFGDVPFAGFREGIAWVDGVFADHLSATRRADGALVEGRDAYHFRIADGRIAEDWDVFFPMS